MSDLSRSDLLRSAQACADRVETLQRLKENPDLARKDRKWIDRKIKDLRSTERKLRGLAAQKPESSGA